MQIKEMNPVKHLILMLEKIYGPEFVREIYIEYRGEIFQVNFVWEAPGIGGRIKLTPFSPDEKSFIIPVEVFVDA